MYQKDEILKIHIPRWEELPELDLYLDQVVTFIDKYLGDYIKNDYKNNDDEKILTKTMINNYVKQKILTAPVKKKYTRSNIAYLFVICILKQVYSISDIDKLIKLALSTKPINEAYNTFCEALENSIINIFTSKDQINNISHSENGYILFNVVQTIASKLYVEKTYLSRKLPTSNTENENQKDSD